MLNTLETLRTNIRALITDLSKSGVETFTYITSSIFDIAESNIITISKVLKNGSELGTGEYSFDSTTNKVTIIVSLTSNDIIEIDYTYYKYSDTELTEYIRASLVWMSIFDTSCKDYEIETDDIYPTPDNQTLDLTAIIASILIQPNWNEYRLPNLTVRYPRTLSKEEKIEKLINRFTIGIGVNDVLTFD